MPEDKPTAEIIDFNASIDWHWQCGCGNNWFIAITTNPKEGLIIGMQCTACFRRYVFDKRPNLREMMLQEPEE